MLRDMATLRQPGAGLPADSWQLIVLPRLTSLSHSACNVRDQASRRNLSPPLSWLLRLRQLSKCEQQGIKTLNLSWSSIISDVVDEDEILTG